MSVGAPPPTGSPFGPHPRRQAQATRVESRDSNNSPVALQREANNQAQQIQAQINQTNIEGNQTIDRLKEDYSQEYQSESVREEAAIEAEKSKGYERLRAIQRQNQAEEQRLRRRGGRRNHGSQRELPQPTRKGAHGRRRTAA